MRVLVSIALLPIASAFAFAQQQAIVTAGGDRGSLELGSVLDVVALSNRLLILDKTAPHLRLVDERGQLRQTLGRRGSGPGEFLVPSALSFDSATKTVFVVDRANARVTEYEIGDTLRLSRTLPTSVVNLFDVCVVRSRIFGISGSNTALIDELEIQDGRLVAKRGLGKPRSAHPLAAHPMVASRSARGPLHCDPSGIVWVASETLGDIHRVNVDTGDQQTVAVKDFHPLHIQPAAGGGLTYSAPDGWYESISSLIGSPAGMRVVIARRNRDGSIRDYQFLDVTADLTVQRPRIASQWTEMAGSARGTVCVANDPVPTVSIFDGGRCP
jgi:hypothetical protein